MIRRPAVFEAIGHPRDACIVCHSNITLFVKQVSNSDGEWRQGHLLLPLRGCHDELRGRIARRGCSSGLEVAKIGAEGKGTSDFPFPVSTPDLELPFNFYCLYWNAAHSHPRRRSRRQGGVARARSIHMGERVPPPLHHDTSSTTLYHKLLLIVIPPIGPSI
jgi:hypothetical protein